MFASIQIFHDLYTKSGIKGMKQKKIGKDIFKIFIKIEINNKINAELEAMAKTIYDYWFLQFDFPNEEGKPYRSSGGKMEWNEKLKREIPKGWKVQSIAKNSISNLIKPVVDNFKVKTYLATADVNGTSIGEGNLMTSQKIRIIENAGILLSNFK